MTNVDFKNFALTLKKKNDSFSFKNVTIKISLRPEHFFTQRVEFF